MISATCSRVDNRDGDRCGGASAVMESGKAIRANDDVVGAIVVVFVVVVAVLSDTAAAGLGNSRRLVLVFILFDVTGGSLRITSPLNPP